jgi:hypothetical protein
MWAMQACVLRPPGAVFLAKLREYGKHLTTDGVSPGLQHSDAQSKEEWPSVCSLDILLRVRAEV